MKRLLRKRLSIFGIDSKNVAKLKNDLKKVGSVDIEYYKTVFPPLFPEQRKIQKSEISQFDESNHIEILLNGTTIIQLFEGSWGFSGNFIDESLSDLSRAKIEEILAKNKYYTGRMAWKYAPWIPLVLLGAVAIGLLNAMYHLIEIFQSPDAISHSIILMILYTICVILGSYMYKQFFWK
ncbi:MAG: hypothetical protein PVF58_11000 [Candidatus Methanofastidiosia archaeon]|jgi:hypothetical protein